VNVDGNGNIEEEEGIPIKRMRMTCPRKMPMKNKTMDLLSKGFSGGKNNDDDK
jgi:hypothetical protein